MSIYKAFVQVQIVHGATTYDNILPDANASFLKLKKAIIKRSSGSIVSTSTIEIFNKGGTYNSITSEDSVNIWTGTNMDGSDKVKVFAGKVVRKENKKSTIRACVLELTAKDKTIDLLNGKVFTSFSAGDVVTGGDLISYTLSDYGQIIKYLMSFQGPDQANPGKITVSSVQNAGSNITQKKVYRYYPTLKILQGFGQICNFDIYVDVNNDLHFQPKNSNINSTILDSTNQIEAAEEIHDSEDEKNQVYTYAGKTTDGTSIVGIYRAPISPGESIKTVWRYNENLAPNATGSTASERSTNARNMAKEWGRLEYEKIKNKHSYRFTINQKISFTVGDIFKVTDTDLSLNQTQLRLTEVEETYVPNDRFKAIWIFDTNLS